MLRKKNCSPTNHSRATNLLLSIQSSRNFQSFAFLISILAQNLWQILQLFIIISSFNWVSNFFKVLSNYPFIIFWCYLFKQVFLVIIQYFLLNYKKSTVLVVEVLVHSFYYTEHCSVWSYQTYRDYYRQYYGADENFGWRFRMKISRRFLEDSRFLEFSRDF